MTDIPSIGTKPTSPRVRVVSESATGLVRRNNEDHLLVDGDHLLYCVADGMGGGAEGENASDLVCAELAMLVRQQVPKFRVRLDAACTAVVCANEAIFEYARRQGFEQMGTTVVLMMFDPDDARHAVICNVGDSRLYRFRRGDVFQLSNEHTVGAELGRRYADPGLASRGNPLSHVLTRAIGTGPTVSPDWKRLSLEPGDRYLLCSDGVHDVIDDRRLGELVARGTLDEAKKALAEEVLACGAPDNFSFVILEPEVE